MAPVGIWVWLDPVASTLFQRVLPQLQRPVAARHTRECSWFASAGCRVWRSSLPILCSVAGSYLCTGLRLSSLSSECSLPQLASHCKLCSKWHVSSTTALSSPSSASFLSRGGAENTLAVAVSVTGAELPASWPYHICSVKKHSSEVTSSLWSLCRQSA